MVLIISSFFLLALGSAAAAGDKDQEGAHPSQEMLDACKDLQIGDKCSYQDDQGHKNNGSCIKDGRMVICFAEPAEKPKE